MPCDAVADDLAPDDVAVALDDGVAPPSSCGFVGIERGVDAAEHHERAGLRAARPIS